MDKKKGVIIKPKNMNDDYCLQYIVPAALDHKDIGRDPQGISKSKPFISKDNWEWTKFPPRPNDWKKFEQNNETNALNILHVSNNTK